MSRARSLARRYALQALYQWQLNGQEDDVADLYFVLDKDRNRIDQDYFRTLVKQVVSHNEEIDQDIAALIDRPLSEVDPVERAILRLGVCEFKYRLDVPYRVVINEAVELAKRFGSENGHKYVNGVLDKLALKLRLVETAHHNVK